MQVKIIIAIYFAAVLAVGLYSYFKVKTQSDYFVAGKKAGLIPVSGSLLATILGGSAILGTIELSQKTGWPALWFLFSASLGLLLLVPVSKYVKRIGNYTLPEMLGLLYGKKAETISSVIIPIAWLGIIAAQIIAAAKILNGLGFFTYSNAAVISGTVFIVYTLTGGQFSILKTDSIQSVLIITGILALSFFSLLKMEELHIKAIQNFTLFNESFSVFDLIVLFLTYSVTFIVGPDIYSRLFCAKSENTATKSVLVVAIILIPVSMLLTWLGIFSLNEHNTGIIQFATDLLPEWAFGLFIAALLSAVMSSADTTLLTSSIILSELFSGNLNSPSALLQTRLFVVMTGILSITIALFVTSIVQALLFALTVFSGAFVIPVLLGLLKIKVKKERILPAIIVGGIMALSGKIIHDFYTESLGNIIVIATYFTSFAILLISFSKE